MRKENTNKAVPLDVLPERRTERCSPRFRPGDRFLDLSFRYLSPGSEGEKCRPLDPMRQIPFIHSSRFIECSDFYTYSRVFLLFPPCGALKYVLVWCIFLRCICTLDQGSKPSLKFCCKYLALVHGVVHRVALRVVLKLGSVFQYEFEKRQDFFEV